MTNDDKSPRSHRDFPVWRQAMLLVEQVYQLTGRFPAAERFGLTQQLRRASVSIPSNIAEGAGRSSTGELGHFLGIALGSAAEVETQLELSSRLGFIEDSSGALKLLEDVRNHLQFRERARLPGSTG